MTAGDDVLVEVGSLAPGGDAAGRQQSGAGAGRVVFVPLAAPGDLVRVRIERERPRVAFGELQSIERPSPVRVSPPCPLFGRCGGCQWQHVEGQAQRQAKGAIVARALGRDVGPARAVGPEYGYRDRARFTVGERPGGPGGDGPRPIGFRARRSHQVVDVPACPLLSAEAAAALPALRARFAAAPAGTSIALQAGTGQAAVMVEGRLFQLRGAAAAPAGAQRDWQERDAADAGAWPDVAEPGGRPLRVPPGAFAQVGRAANAALVAAVAEVVGPAPGQVLELYAGSGNFTRLLVERASAVVACDGEAQALARGRLNVPEADWRGLAALAGVEADLVLVDPPREGLDQTSLALCARARRRIVYVSCDAQTLGRDAGRLAERGFQLEGAVALDLMPQSHHVEVVASFARAP
jgi:23S rRNA (uracil1939-C5)-methyltransferase